MASYVLSRLGLTKLKVYEGTFERVGPAASLYQMSYVKNGA